MHYNNINYNSSSYKRDAIKKHRLDDEYITFIQSMMDGGACVTWHEIARYDTVTFYPNYTPEQVVDEILEQDEIIDNEERQKMIDDIEHQRDCDYIEGIGVIIPSL